MSTNIFENTVETPAKIIADSISPTGVRLTTAELRIHRFIHPEHMTYREWSRNSASSRAIPVHKEILAVLDDCAIPYSFGTNQPGMQSGPPLFGDDLEEARKVWVDASLAAIEYVKKLQKLDVHKEIANRLLEPFLWHKVIVTSNSFEHYFNQRIHADAQKEIAVPAAALKEAIEQSTPVEISYTQFHLPYVTDYEKEIYNTPTLVKLAVARCARVSYLNHDGTRNIDLDIKLWDKLVAGDHMSPLEHVATPTPEATYLKSNVAGWNQVRKLKEFGKLNF